MVFFFLNSKPFGREGRPPVESASISVEKVYVIQMDYPQRGLSLNRKKLISALNRRGYNDSRCAAGVLMISILARAPGREWHHSITWWLMEIVRTTYNSE